MLHRAQIFELLFSTVPDTSTVLFQTTILISYSVLDDPLKWNDFLGNMKGTGQFHGTLKCLKMFCPKCYTYFFIRASLEYKFVVINSKLNTLLASKTSKDWMQRHFYLFRRRSVPGGTVLNFSDLSQRQDLLTRGYWPNFRHFRAFAFLLRSRTWKIPIKSTDCEKYPRNND